jgi:dTDP-glucose 4,6-dehydratase
VWLLTILLSGKSGCAYNVGSEVAINMAELAQLLLKTVSPSTKIQIMKSPVCGKPPEQYVPSTARARKELGLKETVDLEVAIRRTIDWSQKTFF